MRKVTRLNSKLRRTIKKNNKFDQQPFTTRESDEALDVSTPVPLKKIQTFNSLRSSADTHSTSMFALRTENYVLKNSLIEINQKIKDTVTDKKQQSLIMTPSVSRLHQELDAKKRLIEKFEDDWNSLCEEFESKVPEETLDIEEKVINFEEVLNEFEEQLTLRGDSSQAQTLSLECEQLQSTILNIKDEQDLKLKRIAELQEANDDNNEKLMRKTSKIELRRMATNVNNEHNNQMKQLKWEEQRLKQGLEATLKAEREVLGLVEKKRIHLDKLKAQIADLNKDRNIK